MTCVQWKLMQAGIAVTALPAVFTFNHWLEGQPLVSEFEVGAVLAVVLVRLQEVLAAWSRNAARRREGGGDGR